MAISVLKLGFGGSGEVNGIQVLITSGNFDESTSVSYLDPCDLGGSNQVESRSRIVHADGTTSYSGSISFDVTNNAMAMFTTSRMLARNYEFDVGLNDGESSWKMTNCKASSVQLSGSAGGLISATVSFEGKTPASASAIANDYLISDYSVDDGDQPMGYWTSGNTRVSDWSLNFSQDLAPVFLNGNGGMSPSYLRVGLVVYTLSTTTYESQLNHDGVIIGSDSFTLNGATASEGYSFGGMTSTGLYAHTFESAATAAGGSDGIIIS